MKKIITLMFAMLFSIAAFSQERNGDRKERRQREFNPENVAMVQTAELDRVGDLDSIQYQVVYLMNYSDALAMQDSIKARQARREEMRRNGRDVKEQRPTEEELAARRQIMEQRRAIRDAQMKEILTPAQYEKYLQYEKEQQNLRRGKARGRQGAGNHRRGNRR